MEIISAAGETSVERFPAPTSYEGAPQSVTHGTAVACPLADAIHAGDTLAAARAYRELGVSTIPVKGDGSKTPSFNGWRIHSERLTTLEELHAWHKAPNRHGIGVTGGPASGHLAILDFETWAAFAKWGGGLTEAQRKYLARCPVVRAPKGGAHVYCRLEDDVKGCKLARTATGETLIEIRGSQHFVVAPGSPANCHPTGRRYELLRVGWFDGKPFEPMPLEVWHDLMVLAAELNEYRKPAAHEVIGDRREGSAVGDRPGDHFNARVSWGDILEPRGWFVFRASGNTTYWCRPGKKPAGISASTGFCTGETGGDLMYVFSTSAAPFEAERSYSRFAAYALLNHHNDFRAATRALGLAGYGKPLPKLTFKGKAVRR